MLIKIGDKWVDANLIVDLEYSRGSVNGSIGYILLARDNRRDYLCGEYETEAEVIKAMDEAATKINAAQGCKPAKEKTTTEHMFAGGNDAYHCARCGNYMKAYKWYKFCPACGREIEEWWE